MVEIRSSVDDKVVVGGRVPTAGSHASPSVILQRPPPIRQRNPGHMREPCAAAWRCAVADSGEKINPITEFCAGVLATLTTRHNHSRLCPQVDGG